VQVQYVKLRNLYWPYGQRHAAPLRLAWNILDINNPWMGREIGQRLRALRPDIVHTNNLQALSGAVWGAAKKLDLPVVHTIRDLYLLCPRSTMFRHERNCEKLCRSCSLFGNAKRPSSALVDHVVGISKFILDKHLKFGWFPHADKSVIYNSYAPPRKIEYHSRSKRITFGFIGRIDRRKGIEWLLKAFADPRIGASASLIVAGDGEPDYVATLKSQVQRLEVKFVGRRTPEEFFSRIDVAVVPSIIDEALGRAILEAYAYGKPVIASNRGGIPEIVDNGKTGFLVDPAYPEQLANSLARFIVEPELVAKFEPECRSRFANFTPERIVRQYLQVYRSVLRGGLPPRDQLAIASVAARSRYEA
jgi:glycosyltransferase involved in cell wall biosynthesis